MAKYKGFNCDSCGKVLSEQERNRKTTRFEGPDVNGSYSEDLCKECAAIPEGVDFKPFKARGKKDAAANGAADTVVVPDAPTPAAATA